MKTLIKYDPKDIGKLNLKGLRVLSFTEGVSNSDLKGITIQDTVTGVEMSFQMSPYSDFQLLVEKPPVIEKEYVLTGNYHGAAMSAVFKTEAELLAAEAENPWDNKSKEAREVRVA